MHLKNAATLCAVMATMALGLTACGDAYAPNAANTPALAGSPVSKLATKAKAKRAAKHRFHPMTRTQVLHRLAWTPATKHFAHLHDETRTPTDTVIADGVMSFSDSNPQIDLQVVGSSATSDYVEEIASDHLFYFHIPGMLAPGKFTRLDPHDVHAPLGVNFVKICSKLDMLDILLAMKPAYGAVHSTGHHALYGVRMETYTLTLDSKRALAARGVTSPALVDTLPKTLTYHLWFDRDHLIRKVSLRLPHFYASSELDHWGKRVHVFVPAAGDLVGADQLTAA